MLRILYAFTQLIYLSGCSSSKKVNEMAHTYEPILKEEEQVERMNAMIRNSSKLSGEKKDKLVQLVNQQVAKSQELRKEQSHLRAVLIDQLLRSISGEQAIMQNDFRDAGFIYFF
jgi:tryptophanyl-tRNA synthetase